MKKVKLTIKLPKRHYKKIHTLNNPYATFIHYNFLIKHNLEVI